MLLLVTAAIPAFSAETATQIMNRASSAFRNARSISATFSMSGSLGSAAGTFNYAAGKFALVTNAASTWYNGKYMWSYNPRTGETTLIKPTASDIAESNPFSILASMQGSFNATFAKSQPAGKRVLVLIPKSGRNNIRKVLLTLDAKRLVPTNLLIYDKGGTTRVTVSKVVANRGLPASTFNYPKSRYPKARIVDLR